MCVFAHQIWEAKELLRKWGCLITDLKNQRDKLIECISFEDTEWEKLLKKAEHIEVRMHLPGQYLVIVRPPHN